MIRIRKPKKVFVIAHNIRSLFNVGSIFRTADAFGISKIYLTGYTGRPDYYVHQRKIGKVALGAEKFVPWEHRPSAVRLIKELKSQGVKIIALENNLHGIKKKIINLSLTLPKLGEGEKGVALVLGEEVRGVSKSILKLCDNVVEIPMQGKKESLNVSVAFGIVAYQLTK